MSSSGVIKTALALLCDLLRFARLMCQSRTRLAAENLFLRKQLACYLERQVRRRRTDNGSRITLVLLSQFVAWRDLVTIVRPETFMRWHREAFRLYWRWTSRPRGRPRIPLTLQRLIADMASANRTWGEERIAAELRLKLGLTVSPRTVRRYMPKHFPSRGGRPGQSWRTFLSNHAGDVLACDFFVTVTCQRVYVFVMMDVSSRQVLHWNLTRHPTAAWTMQQFRDGIPADGPHRILVHDRDAIFAPAVDDTLRSMQLRVLKTPVRAPQANAFCERLIGSVRRECLDWIIPLNEQHLRRALAEWFTHYNGARPHAALGPGIPDAPMSGVPVTGHTLARSNRVAVRSVLGGLHHEYGLERLAA